MKLNKSEVRRVRRDQRGVTHPWAVLAVIAVIVVVALLYFALEPAPTSSQPTVTLFAQGKTISLQTGATAAIPGAVGSFSASSANLTIPSCTSYLGIAISDSNCGYGVAGQISTPGPIQVCVVGFYGTHVTYCGGQVQCNVGPCSFGIGTQSGAGPHVAPLIPGNGYYLVFFSTSAITLSVTQTIQFQAGAV